jgi:tetratricopeptide (TPR) repeat protein
MIKKIKEFVVYALTPCRASASEGEDARQSELYSEGLSHIKAVNFKLALICFNKILKIDPRHLKARAIRDKLIEKIEHKDETGSEKASEADIETWYNEANAMLELGMYKEAVESFDRALAGWPRNAVILYRKSIALSKMSRYEDAIVCLEKALEINPSFSDAWHAMSANYARLNKADEALKCLDRVVAIDPQHVPFA